jgi:hypothetical protein
VLAADGQHYGTALAAGLAVVLGCVLAAFGLGLADVLRRRREQHRRQPADALGPGVAAGTGTAPEPHAVTHGHPHH